MPSLDGRLGGGLVASAGLAWLSAGPCGAALIVHDNSAQTFTWTRGFLPVIGPLEAGVVLDPTLPASAQTGAVVPHGFGWLGYGSATSSQYHPESLWSYGSTGRVSRAASPVTVGTPSFDIFPLRPYLPGESVGSSFEIWTNAAGMGYHSAFGLGTGWFLGQESIVGIRFDLPSGTHHGWIKLQLVPGLSANGHYQPVAWAYETIPNVPALVPAAGGSVMAMLTCAGLGLVRRRR